MLPKYSNLKIPLDSWSAHCRHVLAYQTNYIKMSSSIDASLLRYYLYSIKYTSQCFREKYPSQPTADFSCSPIVLQSQCGLHWSSFELIHSIVHKFKHGLHSQNNNCIPIWPFWRLPFPTRSAASVTLLILCLVFLLEHFFHFSYIIFSIHIYICMKQW